MENKRKPISKKLRFEIFKRDFFRCQYCGSFPPNVVLEVDHINPLSKGGENDINNLITSCFSCNRGKSNNELNQIPNSLLENIDIAKEKLKQYKQYKKLNESINKIINNDIEKVNNMFMVFYPYCSLSESFKVNTIKVFIAKIGIDDVLSAMLKTGNKGLNHNDAVRYFCGICHNIINNR